MTHECATWPVQNDSQAQFGCMRVNEGSRRLNPSAYGDTTIQVGDSPRCQRVRSRGPWESPSLV